MNKITTDIISTTGINISKYDILPSKVFVNGIEITDVESWNKVISSIEDKDKEIERLNNIINELEEYHIKSMKNLENTEDFKYVGTNHIKILYEEHKRTLDKLKELKESSNNE